MLCGSAVGALGMFVNESNAELVVQCLVTLTEYCQGPCYQNQVRPTCYLARQRRLCGDRVGTAFHRVRRTFCCESARPTSRW